VFAQAAGFAILATISPTALLVMAIFLASANPRTTAVLYVTGAVLMTVVTAVALLFILRAAGLNQPRAHDPRDGLRLGLGILALAAAAVVARFRRIEPELKPASGRDPDDRKTTGLITRLTTRPRPGTAFAAGVILFAPSATFIAAVSVVATAEATAIATAVALVIVVILSVAVVWLPLVTFLAAPEATGRRLTLLNTWLRVNGRAILIGGLAIGGLVLIVSGAVGLAGG
jgi:Sap, sulfolipid-1-addressing protein